MPNVILTIGGDAKTLSNELKRVETDFKRVDKGMNLVKKAFEDNKKAVDAYVQKLKSMPDLSEHTDALTQNLKDAELEIKAFTDVIKTHTAETAKAERDAAKAGLDAAKLRKEGVQEQMRLLGAEQKARKDKADQERKDHKDSSDHLADARDKVKDTAEAFRDFAFSAAEGRVNVDALATAADKLGGAFKGLGFAVAAIGIALAIKAGYDAATKTLRDFREAGEDASKVNPALGSLESIQQAKAAADKQLEIAKKEAGYLTWIFTGGKTQAQFVKEAQDTVTKYAGAVRQAMAREARFNLTEQILGNAGDGGSAAAAILAAGRDRDKKYADIIGANKPELFDTDTAAQRDKKRKDVDEQNKASVFTSKSLQENIDTVTRQLEDTTSKIKAKERELESLAAMGEKRRVQGEINVLKAQKETQENYINNTKVAVELSKQREIADLEYIEKVRKATEDAWNSEMQKQIAAATGEEAANQGEIRATATARVRNAKSDLDVARGGASVRDIGVAQADSEAYGEAFETTDNINKLIADTARNEKAITEEKRKQGELDKQGLEVDSTGLLMTKSQKDRQAELLALTIRNKKIQEEKQVAESLGNKDAIARLDVEQQGNLNRIDQLGKQLEIYDKIRESENKTAELEKSRTDLIKEANKYKEDFIKLQIQEAKIQKQIEQDREDRLKKSNADFKSENSKEGRLERDIERETNYAKNATSREAFQYHQRRVESLESKRKAPASAGDAYQQQKLEEEIKTGKFLGSNTSEAESRLAALRNNAFNRRTKQDQEDPFQGLKDQLKYIEITREGLKVKIPQIDKILDSK